MKTEYRTLSVGNSLELCELEAKCFGDPWTEKMFIDSLSSKYTQAIGAFCEDRLVGYVMWIFAGDCFEILNVATDPEMRRRGIAKRMINLLAGYARECGIANILLEVRQSNTPARTLYEYLGFKAVGVRRNYYKNPVENAILMDLKIEKKVTENEK